MSDAGLPAVLKQFVQAVSGKTTLILPIVSETKAVVLLMLIFAEEKQFLPAEKETAEKVKKLIETYYLSCLQTSKLLEESMNLARQLKTVATLTSIDSSVIFAQLQEEVIFSVIQLIQKSLMCDLVHIFTFGQQRFTLVASLEDGQVITERKTFNADQLYFAKSLTLGIPVYTSDLTQIRFSSNSYEAKLQTQGYRSLLVVPLLAKGELLGALAVSSRHAAYYLPEQLTLTKQVANQIAIALSNTGLIKQLQETLLGTVKSLVAAIDAKSPWTKGHSERVSQIAVTIGKELKLTNEQLYQLQLAALFHDVGKIGTYDVVLDKPAALTEKERELVEKHPYKTYQILALLPQFKEIAKAAFHHHERWDGQGYPNKLAGEKIPFFARIIAVADIYDAMASKRPYRQALSKDKIIRVLQKEAGRQFDPDIAALFTELLKKEEVKKAA